ncbi:hypothetical protein BC936DRAFT_139177 [Jimgerdemannia flammicorona]|uniref:Uncharacterized protein n=1 Tax=Jimgerdemannia flammicorona TaxID=994334 RepID=A0A433BAH3_9FUNG|nr:hypothetical protein BC936DRAFT_139177 [Jimgerdemannia flammicorona]
MLILNNRPAPLVVGVEHTLGDVRLSMNNGFGADLGQAKVELGAVVYALALLYVGQVRHRDREFGYLLHGRVRRVARDRVLRAVIGVEGRVDVCGKGVVMKHVSTFSSSHDHHHYHQPTRKPIVAPHAIIPNNLLRLRIDPLLERHHDHEPISPPRHAGCDNLRIEPKVHCTPDDGELGARRHGDDTDGSAKFLVDALVQVIGRAEPAHEENGVASGGLSQLLADQVQDVKNHGFKDQVLYLLCRQAENAVLQANRVVGQVVQTRDRGEFEKL